MNQEPVNKLTHCTRCRTELSYDKERACSFCSRCNPPQIKAVKAEEKERRYVDVRLTEGRVREIVEEIIDKLVPDMIRDIKQTTQEKLDEVSVRAIKNDTVQVSHERELDQHRNWRSEAKELGVPLNQETGGSRKKEDVLNDIEIKQKEIVSVL